MRTDVLRAVAEVEQVARVVVVTDQVGSNGAGHHVLVQTSPGLNGGLLDGAAYAAAHWPEDGVAALVGDLPALRATELGAALDDAARHPHAFVPDSEGTGTTLLTARAGDRLQPRFGTGSAARHGEYAVRIETAGPGLRQDVDTAADLDAALALGAGEATAKALVPGSS
jgi:2-phospho-L-lactate guanylyltransferase